MMKMPLARAAMSISLSGPASSVTRRAALRPVEVEKLGNPIV
jgi:hypothetical protein